MEQWHIQPSELDNMQFWEYEKILKERKEEQDKQQASSGMNDPAKMGSNMMKQAQSSMKIPKMPNISMPHI